jgi:2-polyprenyl-6-methoxyphenol hydroxylase-like FAD-dependent oxidoreductase
MNPTETVDVVVVGAGPTGLMLAGDLAEAGVRVAVLERRTDASPITRAFAVHARTLEELDMRGVADELVATGTTIREVRLFGAVGIDLARLPSRFASLLVTPQFRTEGVLARRLARQDVTVRRGSEVVGLTQDGSGVDVHVRTAAGETTYRAFYVVGADGVHSVVRRALGLPFPGRAAVTSLMLADVRLDDPPADALTVNATGDAFAFVAPFGDGWYRVFAWNRHHQVPDTAPLDLAEVRTVTRRALGTDLGMHDPRWLSRFHSDERQVPRYRVGRVFLAGDAAHCHSPAGGQGMNTGIQDAANLGWKLAAAVHGWGGESLLDSFQEERHPVGQAVLRSSGLLLRLTLVRGRWTRAARTAVVRTLLGVPALNDRAAKTLSGIGVRYPAPVRADRLVGMRVPDVDLCGGGTLYAALRGGRFVLLGTRASDVALPAPVDAAVPARPGPRPERLVLVRPDGYVGWVGTTTDFPAFAWAYFARRSPRTAGVPTARQESVRP